MSHRPMDVVGRLQVYCNVCTNVYHVPAHVRRTFRRVPYAAVGGSAQVRIVLFAGSHLVKLFFTPPQSEQIVISFPMDRAVGGKWMSDVFVDNICKLATTIAAALEAGTEISLMQG